MKYLWTVFEISVNVLEAFMFFMMLTNRFGYNTERKVFARLGFLVIAAFTTFANMTEMNSVLFYVIATAIEVSYAVFCFDSKKPLRLFYGFSLLVFSTIANSIAVYFMSVFKLSELKMLSQPSIFRLETVSLYLCALMILFLLATTLKVKKSAVMPLHIVVLFALLLTDMLGIITLLYFSIEYAGKVSLVPCAVVCVILFIVSVAMIWLFYSLAYTNKRLYDEHAELTEKKQEIRYYSQITNMLEELRKNKHDNNLHLRTIRNMCGNDSALVAGYLDTLLGEQATDSNCVFSGNTVVDAVVSEHSILAGKNGIEFSVTIVLPQELPFVEYELCSLLGNLLDNACEACLRLHSSAKKYVKLSIDTKGTMLHIGIKNSSNGIYKTHKDLFFTSKENTPEHGLGLKRVVELVKKYDGAYSFEPKPTSFETNVYLPLKA